MRDKGYHSIQGVLVTILLYYATSFVFRWNGNIVFHVLIGGMGVAALYWISGFESRIYVNAFIGVIVSLLGGILFWGFRTDKILWLAEAAYPLFEYSEFRGVNLLLEGLLILFAVALGYLIAALLQNFLWLHRIFALGIMGFAVASVFLSLDMPRWVLADVCCYFVIVLTEMYETVWQKKKQSAQNTYMKWLTPFFVLYFLMIIVAPYKEKPYDWDGPKRLWRNVTEGVETLFGNLFAGEGDVFIPSSGFSENGGLFGGVIPSDKVMLQIQIDRRMRGNLYLYGKSFDTFDGREWIKTDQSTEKDNLFDSLELVYGVKRYDARYYRDYISDNSVQITYEKQRTKTVFLPLKTWSTYEGGRVFFPEMGSDLVLEKKRSYGFEYKTSFYQMNLGSEMFDGLLREKQTKEDEKVWADILQNNKIDKEKYSLEELMAHRERVYGLYTEKAGLSEPVLEWMNRVSEGCDNRYDQLKKIEEALSLFSYNDRPGEMPETIKTPSSYLEYLLLDKKEGYCAYFATAFAMMARELGYPSRYVQGYCVSGDAKEVLAQKAHAWPEVYFEGVGWIPFEPTPGYHELRYTPWESRKVYEEQMSHFTPDTHSNQPGEGYDSAEDITEEPKEPEQVENRVMEKLEKAWQVIMILLVVLLIGVILLIIEVIREVLRRKHRSISEEYRELVQDNFRMLQDLGLERFENETLTEYEDRLKSEKLDEKSYLFLEAYETVLYGNNIACRELVEEVRISRQVLFDLLENEKGSLILLYKIKLYLYHKN